MTATDEVTITLPRADANYLYFVLDTVRQMRQAQVAEAKERGRDSIKDALYGRQVKLADEMYVSSLGMARDAVENLVVQVLDAIHT